MPAPSPLATFIGPLEQLGLPYCITGSVAASVYGEPRLTADIDVVLLLRHADIDALTAAFPQDEYYVPPLETMVQEISREAHGMFNLIHHGTQFKADIFLASHEIDERTSARGKVSAPLAMQQARDYEWIKVWGL